MFSFGKKSKANEQSDWVTEATNSIEGFVDTIRDKAVVPLTTVARALVYGLLAIILGIAALIILAIALVRLLDVYVDNIGFMPEGVWVAHLISGAIFVVAGLLLWTMRSPKVKHEG